MWVLRILAAAGLGTDAVVHWHLAGLYDGNRQGGLSQGDLFRAEAVVSAVLAVLVLFVAVRRASIGGMVISGLAFVVAASALGAVVLSVYRDIGSIGPLPDMYEPFWYPEKVLTAVAEGVAAAASAALLVIVWRRWRKHPPPGRRDESVRQAFVIGG